MAAAESNDGMFTKTKSDADFALHRGTSNGRAKPVAPPTAVDLDQAIIETVTYADLFDYPLTAAEIHRYLYRWPIQQNLLAHHLDNGRLVSTHLQKLDEFYLLPGREALVAVRRARWQAAQRLWPEAVRYGRLMAQLPFVRMVAVTGSLAMGNVQKEADIDYLIVAADDHLWVCRAFVIALVRLAARRQIELCPNYFISQRALRFPEQNLYTAHELVQMVPLFGLSIYQQMRQINRWTEGFLPNADGPPPFVPRPQRPDRLPGRAGEALLRSAVGRRLEQWEMTRKVAKFRRQYPDWQESDFSPDRCKGHFDRHQQRTLDSYYGRLAAKVAGSK